MTASDVDLALAFSFFALNEGKYERGKESEGTYMIKAFWFDFL